MHNVIDSWIAEEVYHTQRKLKKLMLIVIVLAKR